MKLKNWIFISGALFILGSCGESSTNPGNTDSTSNSTTTTTTDNSNAGTTTTATNVEVPATAKTSFETKYPSASNVSWGYYEPYSDIDWEWTGWPAMDTKDYTVRYKMDGNDYYSWYDQDGNWVGTTAVVADHSSLPAPVNSAIKREFKDYTITSVNKENDKNREAFEVKLEKGSDKMVALITADGTVFKKKGKIDGEKVKEKVDVK